MNQFNSCFITISA